MTDHRTLGLNADDQLFGGFLTCTPRIVADLETIDTVVYGIMQPSW